MQHEYIHAGFFSMKDIIPHKDVHHPAIYKFQKLQIDTWRLGTGSASRYIKGILNLGINAVIKYKTGYPNINTINKLGHTIQPQIPW
ncbi:MAG: hypothetical protein ACK5MD_05840 [Flavobacteriales bacterium]